MREKIIIKVGLVGERHEGIPVEEFVYEKAVNNPANKTKLQLLANNWVLKKMEELDLRRGVTVHLYATGLIPALIATLNSCRQAGWKVYVYCWNAEKQNYFAMEVL